MKTELDIFKTNNVYTPLEIEVLTIWEDEIVFVRLQDWLIIDVDVIEDKININLKDKNVDFETWYLFMEAIKKNESKIMQIAEDFVKKQRECESAKKELA